MLKKGLLWLSIVTCLFSSLFGFCNEKEEKKDLLFIMSGLNIGGAERAFVAMINLLPTSNKTVDVCLLQRGGPFEAFIRHKTNVITLDQALRGRYKVAVSYGEWLLPREGLLRVNADRRIQWINIDLMAKDALGLLKNRKNCEGIDCFVCCSEAARKSFATLHPDLAPRTRAINYLVDNQLLHFQAQGQADELEQDRGFKVVTVARLHPQKALDRAIRVHKRLDNEGIRFRWYVVGKGGEQNKLQALINRLQLQDRFILLGGRENPYPYIAKANIFVLPSYFEGYGLVVAEAKILARPILITNFAGAKEQIHSGVNGLIVNNDEEAIYQGLKCLLLHPEDRKKYHNALHDFAYDNNPVLQQLQELFFEE